MRQLTYAGEFDFLTNISKLPMRQLTDDAAPWNYMDFSKLPMRQLTEFWILAGFFYLF